MVTTIIFLLSLITTAFIAAVFVCAFMDVEDA